MDLIIYHMLLLTAYAVTANNVMQALQAYTIPMHLAYWQALRYMIEQAVRVKPYRALSFGINRKTYMCFITTHMEKMGIYCHSKRGNNNAYNKTV